MSRRDLAKDDIVTDDIWAVERNHMHPSSILSNFSVVTDDLLCFSHLRWDFVFQRPQHLLTRHAKHRRVFYFEEPIFDEERTPRLVISPREENIYVAVPHLPKGTDKFAAMEMQRLLLDEMVADNNIQNFTSWYYTPMALTFSRQLQPERVIYDCMDELSHFKDAPIELLDLETELLEKAGLVFTGGHSLYEHKKTRHTNIHAFPSSIDFAHFSSARRDQADPHDQCEIPHPRIGFFGVLDERFDHQLIRQAAAQRPDWQFVLIGPVVKIDPEILPKADNIHYLGMKSYIDLPQYLAHWDLAMLPFAINDSTKFISPTKTPEYLAAGKPVVSTPIRDVIRPYSEMGLVHIADTVADFINAAEAAMKERASDRDWLMRVDTFLSQTSWDETFARMARLELEMETASGPQFPTIETMERVALQSTTPMELN